LARVERERIIETKLLEAVSRRASSVPIHRSSIPRIANFHDLLKGRDYTHIHNNSDWNPFKKSMPDVIGNMCPDVVLRSKATGENRIYIEVKDTNRLADGHYNIEDSQVVRYFLHLLGMTLKNPNDISRAVLLCAPSRWFTDRHNARAWGYFVEHFSGLATKFDIAIGEVHAEDLGKESETEANGSLVTAIPRS
jgi:hypothetical protein